MSAAAMMLLDILLVVTLLVLTWACLTASRVRHGVILFIAFGLVLSLIWARLLAPDVALAEAAIGAGLSGALLLSAVQSLSRGKKHDEARNKKPESGSGCKYRVQTNFIYWIVTFLCVVFAGGLAWSLLLAINAVTNDSVAQAVVANLAGSGVSNPVTAVLLNFRAYDTLLELAVLLTAVLGIFAIREERESYRAGGLVFDGLVSWLVPVLILVAGYLLWVGAHAPGGAFQAGATLAAAGVVLRLAGKHNIGIPRAALLRLVLVLGTAVFLLVGLTLLVQGGVFLAYPPALAGSLILLIETAAMLSIALTLLLAFLGGRPHAAGNMTC